MMDGISNRRRIQKRAVRGKEISALANEMLSVSFELWSSVIAKKKFNEYLIKRMAKSRLKKK